MRSSIVIAVFAAAVSAVPQDLAGILKGFGGTGGLPSMFSTSSLTIALSTCTVTFLIVYYFSFRYCLSSHPVLTSCCLVLSPSYKYPN